MKRILQIKNKKGFTLAEVMMAVAIIVILAGVSFIGVAGYLRSMALLERDSVAKEIFIAAQNHLTMAEGQGFLGVKKDGNKGYGASDTEKGTYYFIVNSGTEKNGNTFDSNSLLGLMLPFGAIDETVRAGGNYIIHYQINPARVLDVFYCDSGNKRYTTKFGDGGISYTNAMTLAGDDKKSDRKNYNGVTVGWFGGEKAVNNISGTEMNAPTITLVNDDVLYATVQKNNSAGTLRFYIEGVTSGAAAYVDISDDSKKIILDDITSKHHFSQINGRKDAAAVGTDSTVPFYNYIFKTDSPTFIPGEDIKIYAEAFDNSILTNIAKSAVKTTNSLFGEVIPVEDETSSGTVVYPEISVGSIRHLENLDKSVSTFEPGLIVSDFAKVKAKQTTDLDWGIESGSESGSDGFIHNVKTITEKSVNPYITYGTNYELNTTENCYLPVSPGYTLEYDGGSHSISNVKVNHVGEAGLFGTITAGSISNLELIDFDITSVNDGIINGNAGALAGKLEKVSGESAIKYHTTTVSNVIAHNSTSSSTASIKVTKTETVTTSGFGAAGGLIGCISGISIADGFGGVYASAASVPVRSVGDAGGLIGKVEGTTRIEGCYSSGHTVDIKDINNNIIGVGYSENLETTDAEATVTASSLVNVISTGTSGYAGGLIGNAGTSTIQSSYSTCSASGATVGGFVGVIKPDASTTDAQLKNCYATGLVKKKTDSSDEGAFVGSISSSVAASGCNYFEAINEREKTEGGKSLGYECLGAVGGATSSHPGITAFDADIKDESGQVTRTALENYQEFVTKMIDKTTSNLVNRETPYWGTAIPYNGTLKTYYNNTYNLRTVEQLGYSFPDGDDAPADGYFAANHYGDWPSPEAQIVNSGTGTGSSSGTSSSLGTSSSSGTNSSQGS